jgi:hypothetical protein
MIQRIQSLLLLLVTVCGILLFSFSVTRDYPNPEGIVVHSSQFSAWTIKVMNADGDVIGQIHRNIYVMILNIASILLAFVVIFMFKKRFLQSMMCRLLILINAGLIVALIYAMEDGGGAKALIDNSPKAYLYYILPSLGIIFSYLANIYIQKDEKLVRSTDRLR